MVSCWGSVTRQVGGLLLGQCYKAGRWSLVGAVLQGR